MKTEFILSDIRFVGFDGDGDAAAAKAKADADAAAAAAAGGDKTYTQAEFDAHMAGLRRKAETTAQTQENEAKKVQRELAAQLELAKTQKGLTDQQKADHQARIEELENEYLTESEKTKRAAQLEKTELTGQLDGLVAERDLWRGNFEREAAANQITRAAATNKALNTAQIGAIINPMIEFEEVQDDAGAGTGKYTPVVKFPDIGEDEKPIVMKYTVEEAVKRMTELEQHANLFADTMKSGIGGTGNADSKKVDVAKIASTDPAEYRRLRREKPEMIYGASKGPK